MNTMPNGDWLLVSFRSRSRHLAAHLNYDFDLPRGATIHTRCGRLAKVCHWKLDDGRWTDCKACSKAAT